MTMKLSSPQELAETIKAYWARRGHAVEVELTPNGFPIRSTIKNGLPEGFEATVTRLKGLIVR